MSSRGDINEISMMIGKLIANQASGESSANQTREHIYNELKTMNESLRQLDANMVDTRRDHKALKEVIEKDVMPVVRTVEAIQSRGVGVIMGLGLASGGIGAGLVKFITYLKTGNV